MKDYPKRASLDPGGDGMRETTKKKLGLFSPITSREDALEITRGAAQAFYFLAVLQTVLGFFIQKAMIADGLLYGILAVFLHLLRSRVAAVLLFLASAAGLLISRPRTCSECRSRAATTSSWPSSWSW